MINFYTFIVLEDNFKNYSLCVEFIEKDKDYIEIKNEKTNFLADLGKPCLEYNLTCPNKESYKYIVNFIMDNYTRWGSMGGKDTTWMLCYTDFNHEYLDDIIKNHNGRVRVNDKV